VKSVVAAIVAILCLAAPAAAAPTMHVYSDYPFSWRVADGAHEFEYYPATTLDLPILDSSGRPLEYEFKVDHHVGLFRVARGQVRVQADAFQSQELKLPATVAPDMVRLGLAVALGMLGAGACIGMLLARGRRLSRDLALTHVRLSEAQSSRSIFPEDGRLPERIDRYEVLDKIGSGGMAVVYRVKREGQQYALKVPLPHLLEHDDFRARFVRELKLAVTLQHPNLVHIYEVNDGKGAWRYPYMVMEFVEGETLEARIERRPLDFATAGQIGAQVLDALHSIHKRGIVHRDIKPGNVMVTRKGNAKVMDFGIAWREETRGGRLTATGDILGTPLYLAPEQIAGRPADARIDVYGVGMMLYEALAGSLPWTASTSTTVMMEKMSNDAPPLREYRPDIPRALEAVIMTMVERDPDDRYPSAAAAREALERALEGRARRA
jgi:hypothetical protein